MLRSSLIAAAFAVSFAAHAHAGAAQPPQIQQPQIQPPQMTPMPDARRDAPTVQQVGIRRCPLGAVQCMGGFVQRCMERYGSTMWMTSGQRCSG